jgi:ribonuclease D
LILDNGAAEYIIQPHAEDMEPLLRLFKQAPHPMFDTKRKLVIFGDVNV